MKKKMSGMKISLLTIVGIVLGITLLFGFFVLMLYVDDCRANSEKSAKNRILDTTGIEIPTDTKMLYLYYAPPWQESFVQYAVFSLENKSANWFERNEFSTNKNIEFEDEFKKNEPSWLKEKVYGISSEYYPDFEKPYYWLNTKNIMSGYLRVYFIYEPEGKFLMIYIPNI